MRPSDDLRRIGSEWLQLIRTSCESHPLINSRPNCGSPALYQRQFLVKKTPLGNTLCHCRDNCYDTNHEEMDLALCGLWTVVVRSDFRRRWLSMLWIMEYNAQGISKCPDLVMVMLWVRWNELFSWSHSSQINAWSEIHWITYIHCKAKVAVTSYLTKKTQVKGGQ